MILKVRKDFVVFKQRDFIAKWFTVVDFHTVEVMFSLTTTEEGEAALSLFCEHWTADKTTLTSIVAAVDSICKKRQKNCLIHGELTAANKALCFFSER